eukprot:CAMPEP_0117078444 /NCGR_PEP_ID=MMETSP0472-20121206/55322_1 /TAXON_ID=693140 ORGANISM="Tiarina fusus, Strain LIS" /NCGR_SAMPLE_ID=MMETSP0472 /ASSEMBLY_ACC=CAM_ASM_000603 /LENGTH=34 /DNA_ID= /DNA_START= /DNA_END= /DNA_ORIENTATION=
MSQKLKTAHETIAVSNHNHQTQISEANKELEETK